MDRRDVDYRRASSETVYHSSAGRRMEPNLHYREASTQAGLDVLGMLLGLPEGGPGLLWEKDWGTITATNNELYLLLIDGSAYAASSMATTSYLCRMAHQVILPL